MRRLISAICTLLFISSLLANSEKIELNNTAQKTIDERSIAIIPSTYHDDSTIILCSSIPLENLQVTIKDETDQVISEEIISISSQQPYIISIGNVEDGVYTLELIDGEEQYSGDFDV